MPKKTTTKKTSKPSQLDPLKSIRSHLRSMEAKLNVCMNRTERIDRVLDSIYAEVGKIHSISDRAISDAYERGKNSVAPAPNAVDPEAPKVGELVFVDSLAKGWLVSIGGVTELWRTPAEFVRHLIKCGHISASPAKPQVTVDEIMEVVEPWIDEKLEDGGTNGLQYDVWHPKWNALMSDLRARLIKLMGE